MPKKIPQPLGTVMKLLLAAHSRGWLPTSGTLIDKPQEERWTKAIPKLLCKPGPAHISTRDVLVQGRDGNQIPTRVYTRPDVQPGTPAVLFIHGGGFIDGGVQCCDNVQRELADITGYVVVALSYRLAPDHPFPAALHDCADVLQWMHNTRPEGLDPTTIAVGGESAGGNLAIALCLYTRDNGGPAITHQTIYYPFTDTSLTSPDLDNGLMGPLNRTAAEQMVKLYGGDDPRNPLINIVGANLAALPPATVITCGHDILTRDGTLLVAKLRQAGVETRHTHHDDMPHGFLVHSRLTSRVRDTLLEMATVKRPRFSAAPMRVAALG